MKSTAYEVTFHDGETVVVYAIGSNTAKILAQAERIKAGKNYLVKVCKEIRGN